MAKTMMKESLSIVICLVLALAAQAKINPDVITHITLDGVPTSVHFNDGDTFKIRDGTYKNSRVRVIGFNTLETYGPVHQWKENTASHLHNIAREATTRAQTGQWSCQLEECEDSYGRLLAICDDLALALISSGLAHAYSVNEAPASAVYLNSQRVAKENHLGLWKYGIPDFIITSLHSADEGQAEPYNRLISTVDGHTKRWYHETVYRTCEKVCLPHEASCMVYVPFEQRYGSSRPDCLRSRKEISWEL